MFVIEDEIHAELCGEFETFDSALAELRSRATVPWDSAPNQCPCQSWKTCGREYSIVQYDVSKSPWTVIARSIVLEISSKGVVWHEASD